MPSRRIERTLTGDIVDVHGRTGTLPVTLTFEPADPLAVALSITTETARVNWTFAIALLAEGQQAVSGAGAVRVWPDVSGPARVTTIVLSDGQARARIQLPQRSVAEFLRDAQQALTETREAGQDATNTAQEVRAGAALEHEAYTQRTVEQDLDSELDKILGRTR